MSDVIELEASVRTVGGKGAAKVIRREGRVPAIVYGDKKSPEPVVLEYMPVLKQYERGSFLSTVYNLVIDGKATRVIPRDIQFDPVRDFILHIDFLRLAKDAMVTVEVPVNFLNEDICPGLKRGGALNIVRHTIELICPGDAIPENIDADLAEMDIGDSLHISAITLPEGVTPTITDRDFTIATIAGAGGAEEDETDTDEDAEVEVDGEAPAAGEESGDED